jgi:hypothetical protein
MDDVQIRRRSTRRGHGLREEAGRMDITTVNDRHLYSATVRLRDPERAEGQVELRGCVVRFGPPGWLTVADGPGEGQAIQLFPTGQVLSVSQLGEVARAAEPVAG